MNGSKNLVKPRLLPNATRDFLKDYVLGPDYELSLAWVSPEEIHKFNLRYRGKDKPTNILSFPLAENEGEILLCPEFFKPEETVPLFIHGLIHLKGWRHGSKMLNEERRVFNFYISHRHDTNHRRRT